MADVSNLKMNEHSDLERTNLRAIKVGNINLSISNGKYKN